MPHDTPRRRTLRDLLDSVFDALGTRPVPLIVFGLSVAVLIFLANLSYRAYEAPALATAPSVEHPATTASFVETVHVQPGDSVDAGAPIATLSAQFLEEELRLIEADIDRVRRQAEWEQARLRDMAGERERDLLRSSAEAERDVELADTRNDEGAARQDLAEDWLAETQELVDRLLLQADALQDAEHQLGLERALARREAGQVRVERQYRERVEQLIDEARAAGSLEEPALRYFDAELAVLFVRREAVLDRLANLTIRARDDGRVAHVMAAGASVGEQTSVASLVSDEPSEVIAYLSPDQDPGAIPPGTEVTVRTRGSACLERAQVLRHGAGVVQAPGQLSGAFGTPVFGFPVHLSVPGGCAVAVGQVLSVDLRVGP